MSKEIFLYSQLPWGVTTILLSLWMDDGNFSFTELIITLAGDLSHHAAPNTIDPQEIENNEK